MKLQIQHLLLVGIILVLCSCSVLGKRQESTKIDLDESSIPQMKIVSSKPTTIIADTDTPHDLTASVELEKKFINPYVKNIDQLIQEKKTNLNQIDGSEALPDDANTADPADYVFGQGGELKGYLKILDQPSDDLKALLQYDENKASDIKLAIVAKNQNCEGKVNSRFAAGDIKIDLSNTDIDKLAANTPSKNRPGKTVKDDILQAIEDEKNASSPEEKKKYGETITTLLIKYLPIDLIQGFYKKFNPKLDEITFSLAYEFEICRLKDDPNPIIYVLDFGTYKVPEKVTVTNVDGHKKRIEIYMSKMVTNDQIDKFYKINNQDNRSLVSLTLGKTKIFRNETHQENTKYTFDLAEENSGDNQNQGENQGNSNNKSPVTQNSSTPIVAAFTNPNSPAWFNPALTKYAKEFYKIIKGDPNAEDEDGKKDKLSYDPGENNINFWDNNLYKANYLSDQEVKNKCNGYKYVRNMNFIAAIQPPDVINNNEYYKFDNGQTRSYQKVLFDEFSVGISTPLIAYGVMNAALNPPLGMNEQNWEIKICFDEKKGFTSFWSSSETSAEKLGYKDTEKKMLQKSGTYKDKDFKITLEGKRTKHWLQVYQDKDKFVKNTALPKQFNNDRIKFSNSLLSISCKDEKGKCFVEFQLAIKRHMDATRMLAYMNQQYIPPYVISQAEVLKKIKEGFTVKEDGKGPKINPNEIFIYGGFAFDPENAGESNADYLTPQKLKADGPQQNYNYVPNVTAQFLFPGDFSELYWNVVAKPQQKPNV